MELLLRERLGEGGLFTRLAVCPLFNGHVRTQEGFHVNRLVMLAAMFSDTFEP